MQSTLCNTQYTGKTDTQFNIRLNNHHKDVHKDNSLEAHQHFRLPNHDFKKHANFTLIEQLENTNITKELATLRLKDVRNFGF